MIVEIRGGEIKLDVTFRHSKTTYIPGRSTMCIITRLAPRRTDKPLRKYFGASDFPSQYGFRKEDGRKRALKLALELGGFDRQDRTEIWKAYHARKPSGVRLDEDGLMRLAIDPGSATPQEIQHLLEEISRLKAKVLHRAIQIMGSGDINPESVR